MLRYKAKSSNWCSSFSHFASIWSFSHKCKPQNFEFLLFDLNCFLHYWFQQRHYFYQTYVGDETFYLSSEKSKLDRVFCHFISMLTNQVDAQWFEYLTFPLLDFYKFLPVETKLSSILIHFHPWWLICFKISDVLLYCFIFLYKRLNVVVLGT